MDIEYKPIRIAHIGSYNRNLGDNIAILNVRKEFEKSMSNIEWISLDILDIFWNRNNNIDFVIKFFEENNFDAIVLGGGGLIEYRGYEKHDTHFKLPFNEEIMKSLKCPTFFVGLGINYFRGREGFSDLAKESLKSVIDYSTCFSLRNDGSINILKDLGLYSDRVKEIPDPGLIFDYEKRDNYKLINNIIQPAFNSSQHINENRFKGIENINGMTEFTEANELSVVPHTPKDYKYFSNYVFDKSQLMELLRFENTNELVKIYLNFDSTVALRGHGQLISMGLNIPGIYLSTQDKLRDFSLLNGFSDYNVDIEEGNWLQKLKNCHHKLLNDKDYLSNWYKLRGEKIDTWDNQFSNFVGMCVNWARGPMKTETSIEK